MRGGKVGSQGRLVVYLHWKLVAGKPKHLTLFLCDCRLGTAGGTFIIFYYLVEQRGG